MNDYKNMSVNELMDCVEMGMSGVSRDAQRELSYRGISSFTGKPFAKRGPNE